MVCIGGSIGKCFFTTETVCCNQQINTATPIIMNVEYLCYAMQSNYFQLSIKENAGGTATPIINKSVWGKQLIPIPPINEQRRIVNKLSKTIKLLTE